jgi:PKD repeat protein
MKKSLLLTCSLLAATFCGLTVSAQETLECSQHDAVEALYESNPELRDEYNAYYDGLIKQSKIKNSKKEDLYIIPVVFHILYDGSASNQSENLSYEQIEDAVETMNLEFNLENSAAANIKAEFKDIAADCNIQFRLATIDPEGKCTNGVLRYDDDRTNSAGDAIKSGRQWPSTKYLNIYTVKTIASGAAGYAYFPGASGAVDGILILHNYVGRIGTGTPGRSSALTHEVGHYLALPHVWGNGNNPGDPSLCNGDDGISDTPLTTGNRTCNMNVVTCGSLDNVQNFMEYAYCYANFTEGQKSVMRAALESSRGGRNNLWKTSNLAATGTDYERGSVPQVLCNSDFEKSFDAAICPGGELDFINLSYSGDNLTYKWTFENGTPSTSTDKNPSVVYNVSGNHDVTLEVSDGTSTITELKEEFVSVLEAGAMQYPYSSNLQGVEIGGNEFTMDNFDNDTRRWLKNSDTGYNDQECFFIENRLNPKDKKDFLISNTMNTEGVSEFYISFRYAYVERSTAGNDDLLRVQVSRNCGETWSTRKTIRGNTLITGDRLSTKFVPSSEDDWKIGWLKVTGYESSGFRFRFEWNSGGGNNIYIDDINVGSSALSVADMLEETLEVYPNPANENLYISGVESGTYNLINIAGKEVLSGGLNANKNVVSIDNLPAGLYLLKVNHLGAVVTKRIVIK